jgi:hypothetical protein
MIEAAARMNEVLAAHTLADIAGAVAAKVPRDFNDQIVNWLANRAAAPPRARDPDSD